MGFGTEILFVLMLGLLVVGPKQMHALLRHVARAKAQFEKASGGFKSQFAAEFDAAHPHYDEGKTQTSNELAGDQ